ncbi:hypothetical protein FLL88_00410 [Vibrio cholerae]|nr:hypothetical protein FLL88_00410 [Vibrio cholerae]
MTREKAIAKSRFMFALLQTQERNFARHSTTLPSKRLPFAAIRLAFDQKRARKVEVCSKMPARIGLSGSLS